MSCDTENSLVYRARARLVAHCVESGGQAEGGLLIHHFSLFIWEPFYEII